MRLINCQVQNVRIHSDLFIDFSPQITLIGGANETGKSSLIEAIHRALFLKATATGKTAELAKQVKELGWKRALVIDGAEVNDNFAQAARNIDGLDILPTIGANVYDILKRDTLF